MQFAKLTKNVGTIGLIFISGCIPIVFPTLTEYRELKGKVVDLQNDKGLESAKVSFLEEPEVNTLSDKDGNFTLSGNSGWDWFGCIPLGAPIFGISVIEVPIKVSHPAKKDKIFMTKYRYTFLGWDFCGNGSLNPVVELDKSNGNQFTQKTLKFPLDGE